MPFSYRKSRPWVFWIIFVAILATFFNPTVQSYSKRLACFASGHPWQRFFSSETTWQYNFAVKSQKEYPHGYKYEYSENSMRCRRCGKFLFSQPRVGVDIIPLSAGEAKKAQNLDTAIFAESMNPRYDHGQTAKIYPRLWGRLHGLCEEFYPDGKKRARWNVKLDHMNGKAEFYFPSGQKRWEGTFAKGVLAGEAKEYYATGVLERSDEYVHGQNEGKSRLYYPNGKLRWDRRYLNGLRHGESLEYFEDGKLQKKVSFKTA